MSNVRNMKLTTVDDLFSTEESRQKASVGSVQDPSPSFSQRVLELTLDGLFEFSTGEGHVFMVRDDVEMAELVRSVSEYGVRQPIQVRPRAEGGYEILSGHRRTEASRRAGKYSIPAIIEDVDDDLATIIMVDTNLGQRQNLLPSEKAFAYKAKLDAMRRQAGRPTKENGGQLDHHFHKGKSRDILAAQTGESAKQISRYIRLTELIPPLLDAIDSDRLKFNPAVTVSYLRPSEQQDLYDYMERQQTAPSLEQANKLKEASEKGDWNLTVLAVYMSPTRQLSDKLTLKLEELPVYFQRKTPKEAIHEITTFANTAAKIRQDFPTLFPESISSEEFNHRLLQIAENAYKERLNKRTF